MNHKMTTSKIKEIVWVKERQGNNWTVYYFTVVMENGDKYPIKKGKMKKDGYQLGQELNYTIEKDWEYDKIFVQEEKKEFGKFMPKDYAKDFISFSASYVKDLVVAGKIEMKDYEKSFDRLWKMMCEKLI